MPILQIELSMQRNEAKNRSSDLPKVTHRKWISLSKIPSFHLQVSSSTLQSDHLLNSISNWKRAEEFQTFSYYQSFTYFQAWENKTILIGRHIFRNYYMMPKLWLAWQIDPCYKTLRQIFTFLRQALISDSSSEGAVLSHCQSAPSLLHTYSFSG